MTQYFVGHVSTAGWLTAIEADRAICAMLAVETHYQKMGYSTRKHYLSLAQVVEGECHYCRVLVAVTDWSGETCINQRPDGETRETQARKSWELTERWMKANGLVWHEAAITVPAELRDGLLDGHAEFLADKQEGAGDE